MAELETTVDTTADGIETSEDTSVDMTGNAELDRLRAELAKQKAAVDKATKEAAAFKKQLRARQSDEEQAAEAAKELQQSMQEELDQLRREKAIASTTTKVLSFVSDESAAAEIAKHLYGAEGADAAIAAFQKAWTAKEKALRMEFGKVPAPSVGSGDGPIITKEQFDSMKYMERLKFATEHPEEYEKLMGR